MDDMIIAAPSGIRTFFRGYFTPGSNIPGADAPFGSLYQLTLDTTGGIYRIIFIVSVFAALICFTLAIVDFYWSKGRARDEAKAKVVRDIWIIIGIGCAVPALGILAKAFFWR